MREDKIIRMECLKIANDVCKSHNCPYGSDELKAEAEKVYELIYPEHKPEHKPEQNTVPVNIKSAWDEAVANGAIGTPNTGIYRNYYPTKQ